MFLWERGEVSIGSHSLEQLGSVAPSPVVSVLGCRCKEFLSKHVHLMCYRICVRALTAIITYHDR